MELLVLQHLQPMIKVCYNCLGVFTFHPHHSLDWTINLPILFVVKNIFTYIYLQVMTFSLGISVVWFLESISTKIFLSSVSLYQKLLIISLAVIFD